MAYDRKRSDGYDFSTYAQLFQLYSSHFKLSRAQTGRAIVELIDECRDPATTNALRSVIGHPGKLVPGMSRGRGFTRRQETYATLLHSMAALATTWKPADTDFLARRETGRMFDHLLADDNWRGRPMLTLFKAAETYLFRARAALEGPAMEIGFQAGRHSRLVFTPGTIDIGFDLAPLALLEAKREGCSSFLVSGDVYALPFADACLKTVAMVHTIDDCQRGAAPALAEVARVLAPGGRAVFSGFTDKFRDASLAFRLDSTGARFARWHQGIDSFFDREGWHAVARQAGLEVEYYIEFVPEWMVVILEPILLLEKWLLNRGGVSAPAGEPMPFGLRKGLRKVAEATWIGADGGRGAEFFMVARKPGQGLPRPVALACPVCPDRPPLAGVPGRERTLGCGQCGTLYPLLGDIPVLHPEMREFAERWPPSS
ncbi:MAG: methyltransferase domain-containing protein [Magnetospirillum sp. WYHS-4]